LDRTLLGHDPSVPGLLHAAPDASAAAARVPLPELDSLARLDAAGVPVSRWVRVAEPGAAVAAASAVGYPVVLKLDAVDLAHKSDIGGVRVGLADAAAVEVAARELLVLRMPSGARRRGLLVGRELRGVELLLGGRRDPMFGPLVIVGLGGVLTEVLDDVAIRLAPVDADAAAAMLDELRGAAILAGIRGRAGIDRPAVVDAIVRLGELLIANPMIVEVDANPVISGPDGTAAVDALVVEDGS
jgi:acetate---CoA ligase (ADP-forming)